MGNDDLVQPAHRRATAKPLALVVDDERAVSEALRQALVDAGLDVVTVATAGEAMQRLAELRYDVAIVDICLPDGSGVDIIQRALACSPPVPCVAITGVADTETMRHCAELGAAACLWKPFRLETLEKVVWRVLRPSDSAPAAPAA